MHDCRETWVHHLLYQLTGLFSLVRFCMSSVHRVRLQLNVRRYTGYAQVREARPHPGCGGGGGVRHGEAAAAAAREEAAERGSHLRSRALSLLPMDDRTAHGVTGAQSRSPKRDRVDHRVPEIISPLSSLHSARAVNVL